jgi:hypothetical protein
MAAWKNDRVSAPFLDLSREIDACEGWGWKTIVAGGCGKMAMEYGGLCGSSSGNRIGRSGFIGLCTEVNASHSDVDDIVAVGVQAKRTEGIVGVHSGGGCMKVGNCNGGGWRHWGENGEGSDRREVSSDP